MKKNHCRYCVIAAGVALSAMTAGCPSGGNGNFDGSTDTLQEEDTGQPGPVIDLVRPNRGPASGGTAVEISGRNFSDGIIAYFGPDEAAGVAFRNSALIVATTPPGELGPVTVRVQNPDGQSSELAGGYTYIEADAITWCVLDRPASAAAVVGVATEPFFGVVEFPGRTNGAGQGSGITAQAGFGPGGSDPTASGGWTWVDAAYGGDVDGPSAGDLARDEYSASLTADAAGSYDAAFRFSSDGGVTWVVCDMNPSDFPSYSPGDAAALEVTSPPLIDFCILQGPATIDVNAGESTPMILGRIRVSGYTDVTSGAVGFITAEAGYGPDGSDPQTSTAWQWKSAAFDSDTGAEDQYGTAVTAPSTAGSYDVAYRFSVDGRATWTLCDTDGSDNGYSPAMAGSMTVEEPPVTVGWCKTQWPLETWTGPGFRTDPVYGRVYMSGVTPGPGIGAGIAAQLGYGARGSDPATAAWTWTDAAYFTDADHTGIDDADEYICDFTVASAGEYSYAYRFSADGGTSWVFCDLGGTDDGFDPADTGYLRVVTTTVPIDWCNTQSPPSVTVPLAGETEQIYGQVYSATGGTASPGRTFGIIAELGYGPDGSDPTTSIEWVWKRANFNVDVGNNDEFMRTLSGFPSAGAYDYAYRFTGSWGASWAYCDLSGADFPAYTTADAGSLTVE